MSLPTKIQHKGQIYVLAEFEKDFAKHIKDARPIEGAEGGVTLFLKLVRPDEMAPADLTFASVSVKNAIEKAVGYEPVESYHWCAQRKAMVKAYALQSTSDAAKAKKAAAAACKEAGLNECVAKVIKGQLTMWT